jgi:hypothetical protein
MTPANASAGGEPVVFEGRMRCSGWATSHAPFDDGRYRTVAITDSSKLPVTGRYREICSGVGGPSCERAPSGRSAALESGAPNPAATKTRTIALE